MDLKSSIGSRLKEVRGALSQSAFADILKVSQGTVGRYERDLRSPDAEYILLLKKHFNVNPNWVISGESPKLIPNGLKDSIYADQKNGRPKEHTINTSPENKVLKDENGINIPQWNNPDPDMYNYVPMAEATLNAGGGSFVLSENTTGRYYAFRKNFLAAIASSPKNLILMKVTGDSMEPKIEDGDTVMIDIGKRQLKNGSIYALGYDDIIVIKEIEKLPDGKALIISKNRKTYPPYETDIQNIRIIGQVIWADRIFVK